MTDPTYPATSYPTPTLRERLRTPIRGFPTRLALQLAERQGFEPWVRLSTDNSLAVSPIRPLSHLSWPQVLLLGRLRSQMQPFEAEARVQDQSKSGQKDRGIGSFEPTTARTL